LIQDPVVTEYVNRIGQNWSATPMLKLPFTIKVIDSADINAFALTGGFFS
jgi:predicted Zn-dependent protease